MVTMKKHMGSVRDDPRVSVVVTGSGHVTNDENDRCGGCRWWFRSVAKGVWSDGEIWRIDYYIIDY